MQMTRSMSPQLVANAWTIALWQRAVLAFLAKAGVFLDLAAGSDSRYDDEDAQQERDAPAPNGELVLAHIGGDRQEHGGGEDLAGLHALQCKASREAARPKGACSSTIELAPEISPATAKPCTAAAPPSRTAPISDLLIGRQARRPAWSKNPSGTCRATSTFLPRVCRPVAEHEGADRSRRHADAVGRERRHDATVGFCEGKKIAEHQRRRAVA